MISSHDEPDVKICNLPPQSVWIEAGTWITPLWLGPSPQLKVNGRWHGKHELRCVVERQSAQRVEEATFDEALSRYEQVGHVEQEGSSEEPRFSAVPETWVFYKLLSPVKTFSVLLQDWSARRNSWPLPKFYSLSWLAEYKSRGAIPVIWLDNSAAYFFERRSPASPCTINVLPRIL